MCPRGFVRRQSLRTALLLTMGCGAMMLNWNGYAQQEKAGRIYKIKGIKDSTIADETPFFSEINKEKYYYNRKALKKVYKYEKERNWEKLLKALREYVSHFGIMNFQTDTYLLWKLAKTIELTKGLEAAKPVYRIVLRHHHDDIDLFEIEFYHNILSEEEIKRYVPLSYYYHLVEYRKYVDSIQVPRGKYVNMGATINSEEADYAPNLNSAGDVLFFTSRRNKPKKNDIAEFSNEDIFHATHQDGAWGQCKMLEKISTKEFNEGSVCVNQSFDTLYFSRCDAPDGYGDCDLHSATLKKEGWGDIRNMGSNVNSPAWDSHPSLSREGDTLYFASDRQGGFGLSDIYFTYKNRKGIWQPVRNAGPIINTRNNEVSPFLHQEEKVLYFSSNGQLYNFGGFDIFKSVYEDDRWTDPLNIGPLVNGIGNEHYFTIAPNAGFIYYAKSNDTTMAKQDLYSFPLPMGAHPEATVRFSGSLKDEKTLTPMRGIVSIIDLKNGVEVAPKFLKEDGSFSFNLIDQNNYLLVLEGDEFLRIEEIFYLSGATQLDKKTTPISRKIEFSSVEFETGEDEVTESMHQELGKVIIFLQEYPYFHLDVSGHTDSAGNAAVNIDLSKRRAKNIAHYLIEEGNINPKRISYEGHGNTRPIIKEERTEEDRATNRRVEFFFEKSK